MTNLEMWNTLALGTASLVAAVLFYVWTALALAAVFRKSGEAGWKAWVPILNGIVLLRIAGLSGWLVLLFLVPLAGFVLLVVAAYRVNVAFGRGAGMTVLAALIFPVWATVLGFGPDRWLGREGAARGPRRTAVPAEPPLPPLMPPMTVRTGTVPSPSPLPPSYGRPAVAPSDEPRRSAPAAEWTPPPLPPRSAPGVPQTAEAEAAPAEADPVFPVMPRRIGTPVEPPSWDVGETDEPDQSWDFDFGAASSTGEVTDAVIGAPAPVSAAPVAARRTPDDRPAASEEPPVTSVPAAPVPSATREPWAPAPSPFPADGEAFPESSGPVSAIVGAPDAGTPRSARSSVSAMHTKPHIPEEDDLEATVVARRKRTAWTLTGPSGVRIPLTSGTVILGRRPSADPEHPDAQLVALDDDTRTVSKTHALLELRDDRWFITDLGSTNGVLFSTLMGTEVAATPGEATEAGDRFLLGDAEVSLARSDG